MFRSQYLKLFLASLLALYYELIVIRYLSCEIRVFAYIKNLPLLACFFGLGIGMILGKREKFFTRILPFTSLLLFAIIRFAPNLGLTWIMLPNTDNFFWGGKFRYAANPYLLMVRYVGVTYFLTALVTVFCIPLGSLVGRFLNDLPQLKAYAVDLLGAVSGIALFTLLSFLNTPPWMWVAAGSALLLLFFWNSPAMCVVLVALPFLLALGAPHVLWSPYYRISLLAAKKLPGEKTYPTVYLSVNYDYHQTIMNLSDGFFLKFPTVEPNASRRLSYELPYIVHPNPKTVLVVGAGTGNDVAAAVRRGAQYVDAVEIDPVILRLGRQLHPEHPYNDPRVHVFLDDARAFFKKTDRKYDLIIFAYLDSHTLIASSSFLRLDNFVYTVQSLEEAKGLLSPNGTVVLASAAGRSFVNARLYSMLKTVFGQEPKSFQSNDGGTGIIFVSGSSQTDTRLSPMQRVDEELKSKSTNLALATDSWPFLYLYSHTIPLSHILLVLLLFIAWTFGKRVLELEHLRNRENLHFFMLGAGFLLLETKGITQASLLFGSTWVVNTIIITAFLTMAMCANFLMMQRTVSRLLIAVLLFASLFINIAFPVNWLAQLSLFEKIVAAGVILALPVFFSGLLFSRAFKETSHPGQALGVNLLGALVGGVAENAVMLGGIPILGVLAILFYVSALIAVPRKTELAIGIAQV